LRNQDETIKVSLTNAFTHPIKHKIEVGVAVQLERDRRLKAGLLKEPPKYTYKSEAKIQQDTQDQESSAKFNATCKLLAIGIYIVTPDIILLTILLSEGLLTNVKTEVHKQMKFIKGVTLLASLASFDNTILATLANSCQLAKLAKLFVAHFPVFETASRMVDASPWPPPKNKAAYI
jgi:hypothetical protein